MKKIAVTRVPAPPASARRIAVIGSGIAGLAAARTLSAGAKVTLFEADSRFGGHAHTVDLTLNRVTYGVDTGFLVYNERTYPGLIELFRTLGVRTVQSDMSFSVQVGEAFGGEPLEWSGSSLPAVFCQRGNLVRPRFWRMLRDLMRFNSLATELAEAEWNDTHQSLGDFLRVHGFGDEFRDWYLLPMVGCIWSSALDDVLRFPAATLLRFCHNHGLLQVAGRPQWFTVDGGSRKYVERIVAALPDARAGTPVRAIRRLPNCALVSTDSGTEAYDQVVIATHSDQALRLLADPSPAEQAVLAAIRFQDNRAVLHTDSSVLPRNPLAHAAWNFESQPAGQSRPSHVCVHYLLNKLQPLPWRQPVIVSLNPIRPLDPERVVREFEYAHPVMDTHAIQAQAQLPALQGVNRTWFCGAWTGYGFHEDGLRSGQSAAAHLLVRMGIDDVAEALA